MRLFIWLAVIVSSISFSSLNAAPQNLGQSQVNSNSTSEVGVKYAAACQYNPNAICTEEGLKANWECPKADSEDKACACNNCGSESGVCKKKACRKK